MNSIEQKKASFERLLIIMDELREQCPWDKKQTFESLRPLTIEETYELADAIIRKDDENLKEELGDVMLHLVFYARIASEKKMWDIDDVLNHLCEKMIRRHPHIYGDIDVNDENEVKRNWEKIKQAEKKGDKKASILDGVPIALPALVKAERLQEKTKQVGFEWENDKQVWAKVKEEVLEFEESVEKLSKEKQEEEFGDVLFSLVNYARFKGINPENALQKVNQKFINRFQFIEKEAVKSLEEMSLEEMDGLWNEAKKNDIH